MQTQTKETCARPCANAPVVLLAFAFIKLRLITRVGESVLTVEFRLLSKEQRYNSDDNPQPQEEQQKQPWKEIE